MQGAVISMSEMEHTHTVSLSWIPPYQTKLILKAGNCPFICSASCAGNMPNCFKCTTDRTRQLWTPPESNLESLNEEFASLNFSVYAETQRATCPCTAEQAASLSWSIASTQHRLSALLVPSETQQCCSCPPAQHSALQGLLPSRSKPWIWAVHSLERVLPSSSLVQGG